MKYRTNSKTGESVSLLGFGAMRLPLNADGSIDEAEAVRMIRYAIDNGVNYVDTAYPYHNGKSEPLVGKALKDGYREKVILATKLPVWAIKKREDRYTLLETQLKRLDVPSVDNYLVHDINEGSYNAVKKFDVMDFMREMKAADKIKNIGFSYHGSTVEFFKELIDLFDWDFVQIQLNYMDAEYQAGVAGMKYAAAKGIPVVIMEPLRGGKLVNVIPDTIRAYWDRASVKRTPAEWALAWVANFPEVLTILSGMSAMEQVEDNLRILSAAEQDGLTAEELAIIEQVADEYNKRIPYGCTACRYCLPCPAKIEIPAVIEIRNEVDMYGSKANMKFAYDNFLDPKPTVCTACKQCEEICPQHLNVSGIMAETAGMFA
ncbi:MAG: aldo/keto reductase [Clostridiales Family XIII bacterium]|jgi:predicted aldo/keto reductase-like oxidoreductase|nr:aldo/keto reductase [Clostridiales Family XIII bacterium]